MRRPQLLTGSTGQLPPRMVSPGPSLGATETAATLIAVAEDNDSMGHRSESFALPLAYVCTQLNKRPRCCLVELGQPIADYLHPPLVDGGVRIVAADLIGASELTGIYRIWLGRVSMPTESEPCACSRPLTLCLINHAHQPQVRCLFLSYHYHHHVSRRFPRHPVEGVRLSPQTIRPNRTHRRASAS